MEPQQALALAQVDTQREALRQQSVGSIIDAHNVMSEIDRREAAGALDVEQANRLRRVAPYDVDLVKQELAKGKADVAFTEAKTLTESEQRQYDTERKRLESLGYQVPIPGVGTGMITGAALPNYLNTLADAESAAASRAATAAHREATAAQREIAAAAREQEKRFQQAATNERLENARIQLAEAQRKNAAQRLADSARAEVNIVDPKKESYTTESAAAEIDLFNSNSEKPYVYVHLPAQVVPGWGILGGGDKPAENRRVDLPERPATESAPARKYTAREIYLMALAARKDVKTFLEEDFYPKAYGKKAPWQQ